MERSTLRLKPKMNAQRLRHGFPWVYANETVTDRRTRALAPGTVAHLQDSDRVPLGTVAVNPNSKIIGRVLDLSPDVDIDQSWVSARVQAAYRLRARIFRDPFYRLIHAEADGLPGVIVDRFGSLAVLQPNAAWADARVDLFVAALCDIDGIDTVVL
ncbi:MAG: RlmI/RlmK family 23S rRNA methyltransferase, partial [Pseudomonadota bacterium]